jgi:hypothetical protein
MSGGQPGLENEENFIYLGKITCRGTAAGVFFFLHVAYVRREEDLVVRMCCDVYNCMIQETLVQRGDSLVVFHVDAWDTGRPGRVMPVAVDHAAFPVTEFPDGALECALGRLSAAERPPVEGLFVVTAEFEKGLPWRYLARELRDVRMPKADFAAPKLAPLRRALSIKPIPYLATL